MAETTLLPCPFCGGEAEAITGPVPCWWGVICRNCDVWRDDRAATKAEAIAAWNRRASTHPAGTLLLVREDGSAEVVKADVAVERIKAALADAECYCAQVQGFTYGAEFVIRDLHLPPDRQEVFRAPYDAGLIGERMKACHGSIRARAALSALGSKS